MSKERNQKPQMQRGQFFTSAFHSINVLHLDHFINNMIQKREKEKKKRILAAKGERRMPRMNQSDLKKLGRVKQWVGFNND